jgi:anti-sigma-K factor RskA
VSDPSESRCEEREQAAAYLLGALDPVEGERYQRHLSECPTCRGDVARLQPTVDALATSTPRVRASEALRGRVMAQVRAEAALFKAAGPGADRAPARRRWATRRLALVGAGAAVACGVVAGGIVVGIADQTPAPQTIHAEVSTSAAPNARAELRRTGSRAELIVSGMPQPPQGKIYEVWLARAGAPPQPTDALFSVTDAGAGSIDVPGNLHSIKRVLVTAEPFGGSRHPTTSPIIIATL